MLTVQPGEDLIAALEALAFAEGWADAYVTGTGSFELVELTARIGMPSTTVEQAELLALSGRVRRVGDRCLAVLRTSVLHEGRQMVGRIDAAITGEMLLLVDARAAARPKPAVTPTPALARPPSEAPRPAEPVIEEDDLVGTENVSQAATKPLSQSFSTKPVIRRVHNETLDEDDSHSQEVEVGDYLEHPQLGLCEVVGDDESGGTQIRMSSGRVRTLKLEALHVMPSNEQREGRRVWRVAGPRRR